MNTDGWLSPVNKFLYRKVVMPARMRVRYHAGVLLPEPPDEAQVQERFERIANGDYQEEGEEA